MNLGLLFIAGRTARSMNRYIGVGHAGFWQVSWCGGKGSGSMRAFCDLRETFGGEIGNTAADLPTYKQSKASRFLDSGCRSRLSCSSSVGVDPDVVVFVNTSPEPSVSGVFASDSLLLQRSGVAEVVLPQRLALCAYYGRPVGHHGGKASLGG